MHIKELLITATPY